MTGNSFSALYKTWTTVDLLNIIDHPEEYQSPAVEAAGLEIESRKLTPEELASERAVLVSKLQDEEDKLQRSKALENKVKSAVTSVFDSVNPLQKSTPTSDRYIKFIAIVLCGWFLYQLYMSWGFIIFMMTSSEGWEMFSVADFLFLMATPVAGLLLWFKKRFGWILAVIILSHAAAGILPFLYWSINNDSIFDQFIFTATPAALITTFIFFAGMVCVLCRNAIRTLFTINVMVMTSSIGIGTVFILPMAYEIFAVDSYETEPDLLDRISTDTIQLSAPGQWYGEEAETDSTAYDDLEKVLNP